jgi:NhaP-type Na+/H+ or K+/H+ antiporter
MHDVNVVVAVAAAVVVALGLLSGAIKRSVLSVPLLALLVGVAAGPVGLGWFDLAQWPHHHTIVQEAARFTLAISVMGIALRTPVADYRRLLRPTALLLTIGMLGMWGASSALAWVLLGLAPLTALLLGAVITPTDPVVASSIVTGAAAERSLPDRVRSTLSLESGANDGLAYLFVVIPILLLAHPPAVALDRWVQDVLLVGVLAAVAIGAALGGLVGAALRLADRAGLMEKHSFLSLSVALSLLAVTLAKLAGSDGILAAFAAGLALSAVTSAAERVSEENIQEAISKLFNLPIFVLLGAALPWSAWVEWGWLGVAFAVAVLLLRRPPVVLLLAPRLGAGLERRDGLFLAWFGPIGVAAIYYALLALERTGDPTTWHLASLVIAASVLAHGVTGAPFMAFYRRAAAGRRDEHERWSPA